MRLEGHFNINFKRAALLCAAAVLAVGFLPGCRSTRSGDRGKVLEAENINLRQVNETNQEQIRMAHATQDVGEARERELNDRLTVAEQEAAGAAEARAHAIAATDRLSRAESDLTRSAAALAASNSRVDRLLLASRKPAPRPAPVARPAARLRPGGSSPQTEAMRRDLQRQLASYGIRDLKVEVRRDGGGRDRIAIVLPDAFPPGKATLAYNASAVKAVISVGKMIRENYPDSNVLVEGHTDSDPIRKSNWGTNENLSRARAQAVETLLTNSGVSSGDVSVEGLGASQPLAMGSTRRAKSRNRRVEIFIAAGN